MAKIALLLKQIIEEQKNDCFIGNIFFQFKSLLG